MGSRRHGPGDNAFNYFVGPFDVVIEYTAEVQQIDDSYKSGQPTDWTWPLVALINGAFLRHRVLDSKMRKKQLFLFLKGFSMKFTTFHKDGQDRLGLIDGDHVIDFNKAQPKSMQIFRLALKSGVDLAAAAQNALSSNAERLPMAELANRSPHSRTWKDHLFGLELF